MHKYYYLYLPPAARSDRHQALALFYFTGSNHTIQITLLFRCSPGTGVAFPRNGTYNTISGIPNINHARWGNDNFTPDWKNGQYLHHHQPKKPLVPHPPPRWNCHPQQTGAAQNKVDRHRHGDKLPFSSSRKLPLSFTAKLSNWQRWFSGGCPLIPLHAFDKSNTVA